MYEHISLFRGLLLLMVGVCYSYSFRMLALLPHKRPNTFLLPPHSYACPLLLLALIHSIPPGISLTAIYFPNKLQCILFNWWRQRLPPTITGLLLHPCWFTLHGMVTITFRALLREITRNGRAFRLLASSSSFSSSSSGLSDFRWELCKWMNNLWCWSL